MPEDGGKKAGLCLSVIMNIVMIVAIIAMFVITIEFRPTQYPELRAESSE